MAESTQMQTADTGKVSPMPGRPAPAGHNNALIPANMDQAMRLADMISKGRLVPEHLQGQPSDCLLVVEQSMRWNMSPFAVAQSTSCIKGKLMFEGKLVAAAVNNSGLLSRRLNCTYHGDGQNRAATVFATLRGETEPREIHVRLADVATSNGVWQKQPDQQLFYAGARIWARRHTPEVMLGVYTPEEFGEEPDAPEPQYRGQAELQPYPDDKFEENLPQWREAIQAGRAKPAQIIAKVSTRGQLSEEQAQRIRDCESAEEAPKE